MILSYENQIMVKVSKGLSKTSVAFVGESQGKLDPNSLPQPL